MYVFARCRHPRVRILYKTTGVPGIVQCVSAEKNTALTLKQREVDKYPRWELAGENCSAFIAHSGDKEFIAL